MSFSNVGSLDRLLRIFIGAGLFAFVFLGGAVTPSSPAGIGAMIVGGILIATAFVSFCPLMPFLVCVLGARTNAKKAVAMKFFGFFGFGEKKSRIKTISVIDAHEGVNTGIHLLMDVRRPNEWIQKGRPQGSYGVTLQDPDFVSKIDTITKGDKAVGIAILCLGGARSMQGAKTLLDAGFNDVRNVKGGFKQWQDQNLPVDLPPFFDQ